MNDKYGTRLISKSDGKSRILAITSPQMIEDNYIISKTKDAGKREKFSWKPMDADWQSRVENLWWWGNNTTEEADPKMYDLRDKLLSFGGNAACLPIGDEDIDDILEQGQFWFGSGAKMKRGRASKCHSNSCELYDLNKDNFDIRICTGYALSEDGLWRQHSWLIIHNSRSNQIVETTVERIAYFGFVMTPGQCEEFCMCNLW